MFDTTFLILSDSHTHADDIDLVLRRTDPAGLIFAGDGLCDLERCAELFCPVWAVRGNCDPKVGTFVIGGQLYNPVLEEVISIGGLRILLMHGHEYDVKRGLVRAVARAAEVDADILIFGHTHIPVELHLTPDDNGLLRKPLTVFNPGSLADWREPHFGTLTIRRGVPLFGLGTL